MSNKLFEKYKDKLPEKLLEEVELEIKEKGLKGKDVDEVLERINKSYENSKIDPGESIGVITAESFGEPGTQMSVPFGSKIITKINNKIKIIKIGNFIDGLMRFRGSLNLDNNSEILPIEELDIYVPSLNNNEKVEWKKVSEISRHKTDKKLLKLTTKNGRKIIATDNHSFVIRKNNKVAPIVGNKLKIGDRIPVVKSLKIENPIEGIIVSDVLGLSANQIIYEGDMFKSLTSRKSMRNYLEFNELTGWFIGAYLAEGFANQSAVGISNINNDFQFNTKSFADYVGLDYVDRTYDGEYSIGRIITFHSVLLSNFMINTCKTGSKNKKVPDFAFSASDNFVKGLLRGYFDGDANFTVDRKMIRVSSNSKELLDGISLLLNRFDIFANKKRDKKQHYLMIPYKYAPQFLLNIGSDIEYKRNALIELNEMAKSYWNENSQDYNDMISGFGNLFYDTAKKLGVRTRYINNFTKRQKIGRTALFRWMKKFELVSKEKNVNISKELEIMRNMFNSDVVWDEIVKIEYVDDTHEFVYDLSVPGLETFTTFDGMLTHNTLDVFHLAGVAEVQVTRGLPRLIEIFDARLKPSSPTMNVQIKSKYVKNDNDITRIASHIKQITLEEITIEFSLNMMKGAVDVTFDEIKVKKFGFKTDKIIESLLSKLKHVVVKKTKKGVSIQIEEGGDLSELYKIRENAKKVVVRGIPGVTQVVPTKKDGKIIILCAGSNLKEIMKMEEVEVKTLVSNDIKEVCKVFGIEAARQTIMNEVLDVIENQGLDIDIRHIMFLADLMTHRGEVNGVTRGGITGEKESVLARASFETPDKHLIDASIIGEKDELRSVIENVIINQPIPTGTGLPGLIAKIKESKKDSEK